MKDRNGHSVTASELELSNDLRALSAAFCSFKELMKERDGHYSERDQSNRESVRTAREEQRTQADSLNEKIALGREEIERQIKELERDIASLRESRSEKSGEKQAIVEALATRDAHTARTISYGLLAIGALQLILHFLR